jgi:hypothetical protein
MVIAYVSGKPAGPQGADLPTVLEWLADENKEAELRTETGRLLGRFIPEPICPWDSSITKEELDRRVRESGRSTLDEFWRRMGVK